MSFSISSPPSFLNLRLVFWLGWVASELWSQMHTDMPGFCMGAGKSEFRSSCLLSKHFTHQNPSLQPYISSVPLIIYPTRKYLAKYFEGLMYDMLKIL